MRKTPYLSIVIPAYNASDTLGKLLGSINASSYKNFEVIIGDDASNEQYLAGKGIHIVRLTRNRGPAAARNAAVKRARGNVLVFLDADVTCYPDTLAKIAGKYKEDHDLTAITGVWDKHQYTKSFFPQFKAMRDWSYWTNERQRDGYYYLFSTRIAAIRREVFTRLGGFNEAFRQMEDVEFTYRIAKRYAIIFAPDVRVHHEFEGFWAVARKYFWRSFYWAKLYKARKKFDPVATTMSETATAITGVGGIGIIGAGILLYFIFPFVWVRTAALVTAGILFFFHLVLLRKFLWFCWREKGLKFAVKSVGTGLLLYIVILAGAAYYQIRK
jgi:glycosyltransferase involved in cell wall biosynthesis